MKRKMLYGILVVVVLIVAIIVYFQPKECYFSICQGKCMDAKYRANEECPHPPPENFEARDNSKCVVDFLQCKTVFKK